MVKVARSGSLKRLFGKFADDVPQIVWSVDANGRHDYVNRRLKEFVGDRINTINADNWTSLIHPEDRERVAAVSQKVFSSTEPYEIEYRLLHHSGEYRWLHLKAAPKLDENGHVVRWYGTSTDIHLEKLIGMERELVARELDHRIKNLFALVNGLVSLSVREAPELAPVAGKLRRRLEALHNAHHYVRISGTDANSATVGGLKGLIEAILRPYAGPGDTPAAKIDGDNAPIDTGETTSFALLIHELATNSVKYGALSAQDGALSIRISNNGPTLRMTWIEFAASIRPDFTSSNGFGATLLKLTAERQLSGRIARRQGHGYLCYVLTIPRNSELE